MEIDVKKLNETIKLLIEDVHGICSESAAVIWEDERVQIQLVVTGDEDDFIEHQGDFICMREAGK